MSINDSDHFENNQSPKAQNSSRAYYKELAVNLVNNAVHKGNTLAQQNPGSKRAIAATTASTILEMGLDRYNNRSSRSGSIDLTDEQINHIAAMAESAGENEIKKSSSSTTNHFADRMIEKIMKSSIPQDIPEREIFEKRLNDPERNKRPGLSIGTLTSNVKQLASKMTNFFAIQYEIIHIITWKQPNKTLSVLVLYTAACLWPHLILAYPLIFILFGIMIPGYVHRHPPMRSDLIKVKKRGQSLLKFLNATPETSIVEDMVDENYLREDAEIASSTYSISEEASDITISSSQPQSSKTSNKVEDKKESSERRKSNVALLINLRDFQNLTTDVLQALDNGEKFYYETAGFKDERLSTFIFYGILVATFATLFLGQFIPWRLIFINAGWIGLILCHPKAKKYLIDMSKSRKENAKYAKIKKEIEQEAQIEKNGKPEEQVSMATTVKNDIKQFDRNDIIVDDKPEVRIVEVYELQIKSILKSNWSFYRYSTTMYDKDNKNRIAGKRPVGVDHLNKVLPPKDWKFDMGFVNKWVLDTKPKEYIKERSLDPDLFIIKSQEDNGWIYDNMKDVVHSEIIYEFRRRRLYRECYRYGRPHKKPKSF
ncbi:uncharacterized protein KGF55_000390 [Candida pseudojiufengensis]|uniref:uncharacterized protein n=1 Tax=Candida pseudojiufengensis TaxID=497109 RepID=UPI002225AF83|nr:uncharacterized protein KGF55_000390 [Candida pseudojiufengensis]KAI5966981.1 hypothetical protein KGF55_000390 [Candida pseudojiufengensis]